MRGLVRGPFAMARPTRSAAEHDAVRSALASMPASLSRRACAEIVARRVVAELLAAEERSDPVELGLIEARRVLGCDPVLALATCPEADLAGELMRARVARFVSRGCRWISRQEWDSETIEVGRELAQRLAERFRRR